MTRTLQEILDSAEQSADAAEAHEPTAAQERDPASWHALRAAVAARASAEQEIASAVAQMRTAKYSWATIGGLLGTSAQAAQQRYGAPAKSKGLRVYKRSRSLKLHGGERRVLPSAAKLPTESPTPSL